MDADRLAWLTQPTRARILAAAEAHFAADGFTGSSVDQVAATAGVSKSHLYYHFESKDVLLASVIELRTAQLLADKDQVFDRPLPEVVGDPDKLAALTHTMLTRLLVPRRDFIRMVLVESIRCPEAARPVFAALTAVLDDAIARFAALGTPADAAKLRRWLFFFGLVPALYVVAVDESLGLPGGVDEVADDLAALEGVLLPIIFGRP